MRVIFIVLFMLQACSEGEERVAGKPTRTECIVKIKIKWDERSKRRQIEAVNNIPKFISLAVNNGIIDAQPDVSVSGMKNDKIYFQFHNRCKDKQRLAKRIFEVGTNRYPDFPQYKVTADKVVPSPETIDHHGPSWRGSRNET